MRYYVQSNQNRGCQHFRAMADFEGKQQAAAYLASHSVDKTGTLVNRDTGRRWAIGVTVEELPTVQEERCRLEPENCPQDGCIHLSQENALTVLAGVI